MPDLRPILSQLEPLVRSLQDAQAALEMCQDLLDDTEAAEARRDQALAQHAALDRTLASRTQEVEDQVAALRQGFREESDSFAQKLAEAGDQHREAMALLTRSSERRRRELGEAAQGLQDEIRTLTAKRDALQDQVAELESHFQDLKDKVARLVA